MATKSVSQKAIEQQFMARPDGDGDYFPKGLAKPGFRVNDEMRKRLVGKTQAPVWLIGLLMAGAIGLVRFGGFAIARSCPNLAPYANSRIICWAVAIPVFALALWVVAKTYRRDRDHALKDVERARARFSKEDVRASVTVGWKQLSRFKRLLIHAFIFGITAIAAISAYDHLQRHSAVSHVEGTLLVLFATFLCFGWVFILMRLACGARLARSR